MSNRKAIGILGGTFDPVHYGHLRLVIEIKIKLNLDQVRLIPLKIPAHRDAPIANEQQRLDMLQLAINGMESLKIDDRELKREETSYSINTLRSLREEFPDDSLSLIVGQDAFQYLDSWKEWQSLLDYAHIVIASRPSGKPIKYSDSISDLLKTYETNDIQNVQKQTHGYITHVSIPLLDISSTLIRDHFLNKTECHFLLPDSVIDYINKEQLYA